MTAVETVFMRCADALRAEFGSKPGRATEEAYLQGARAGRGTARRHGERAAHRVITDRHPLRVVRRNFSRIGYFNVC